MFLLCSIYHHHYSSSLRWMCAHKTSHSPENHIFDVPGEPDYSNKPICFDWVTKIPHKDIFHINSVHFCFYVRRNILSLIIIVRKQRKKRHTNSEPAHSFHCTVLFPHLIWTVKGCLAWYTYHSLYTLSTKRSIMGFFYFLFTSSSSYTSIHNAFGLSCIRLSKCFF